jgi:hypothetical protein
VTVIATSLLAGAIFGVIPASAGTDPPAEASGSPVPLASADPMASGWVTGVAHHPSGRLASETRTVDGVEYEFIVFTDIPIEMSDPRLTGTLSQVFYQVEHPVASDASIVVFRGEYRLENEAGTWEGAQMGMERSAFGSATPVTDTGVLVGSGGYEGLTAYLVFDFDGTPPVTVTGAIFPGDLPPMTTFEELPAE